jgi:UDP-N-acetylmuramyl pentapeptide synthase
MTTNTNKLQWKQLLTQLMEEENPRDGFAQLATAAAAAALILGMDDDEYAAAVKESMAQMREQFVQIAGMDIDEISNLSTEELREMERNLDNRKRGEGAGAVGFDDEDEEQETAATVGSDGKKDYLN